MAQLGINLSTIEDIEYDTTKLQAMTHKDLTYQMLCREDLKQPNRPFLLQAKQFHQGVVDAVFAMIQKLRANDLDAFANTLEETLSGYVEDVNSGDPVLAKQLEVPAEPEVVA